jgi:hypothetical protein
MEMRTERAVGNQWIFRRANERLRSAVEGAVAETKPIPFLCECPDDDCTSAVDVTIQEYRAVREHPDRYVVVPGHARAAGERVASTYERYQVVEKSGA